MTPGMPAILHTYTSLAQTGCTWHNCKQYTRPSKANSSDEFAYAIAKGGREESFPAVRNEQIQWCRGNPHLHNADPEKPILQT